MLGRSAVEQLSSLSSRTKLQRLRAEMNMWQKPVTHEGCPTFSSHVNGLLTQT